MSCSFYLDVIFSEMCVKQSLGTVNDGVSWEYGQRKKCCLITWKLKKKFIISCSGDRGDDGNLYTNMYLLLSTMLILLKTWLFSLRDNHNRNPKLVNKIFHQLLLSKMQNLPWEMINTQGPGYLLSTEARMAHWRLFSVIYHTEEITQLWPSWWRKLSMAENAVFPVHHPQAL